MCYSIILARTYTWLCILLLFFFLFPFRFRHGCFLIKHPDNVSSHPIRRLNLAHGPPLHPHNIGNGVRSGCPDAAA